MTATRSSMLQTTTPEPPTRQPDDTPDTPPSEPPPVPIKDPLPDTVEPGPYVTDEPDSPADLPAGRA